MNDKFEERAAIMEYDGGMTREEAEIEAYKDVYQNPNNKPVLLPSVTKLDCDDPFQND